MEQSLKDALAAAIKAGQLNEIRAFIHETAPYTAMPVDNVQWIPIDEVVANNYNPNAVATQEMKLLHTSIDHDGYTQPVVAIYDKDQKKYVIVDGFHRYSIMRYYKDIADKTGGMLPVVVLQKDINDRMASTVRHNRARGHHSITGMGSLVFSMLDNGWDDETVCNELGMEAEELLRLKHITGFSKLFENVEYSKAWETKNQIQIRQKYEAEQAALKANQPK